MRKLLVGVSLIGALSLGAPALAQPPGGVKVGTLSCHEHSGWGLVLWSSRRVRCVYSGANGSARYTGRFTDAGVDVGYHGPSDIVWAVFAPTTRLGPRALNGHYVGGTAAAAVGVGLGANALVGGSDRTVSLQPLSVSGGTGLAADAGIGSLTLANVPGTYRPA
ncbi:MAG TPA: DUF992 domain-containing protein [Caulobacteraceae bacterium]|nr:DUF992 domain-containing protein [Caulobacteraceae bacterium]